VLPAQAKSTPILQTSSQRQRKEYRPRRLALASRVWTFRLRSHPASRSSSCTSPRGLVVPSLRPLDLGHGSNVSVAHHQGDKSPLASATLDLTRRSSRQPKTRTKTNNPASPQHANLKSRVLILTRLVQRRPRSASRSLPVIDTPPSSFVFKTQQRAGRLEPKRARLVCFFRELLLLAWSYFTRPCRSPHGTRGKYPK